MRGPAALAVALAAALAAAQGLPTANPSLTSPTLGSTPAIGLPSASVPSSSGSGGAVAPLAYGSVFEGKASWYGVEFKGRKTASGELYDPESLTAAHRSLPLGSLVRVTDLDTGASVVVRINDRGPFVADRVIDLSEAAARLIGLLPAGTAMVRCELLRPEDAAAFGQPPVGAPSSRPGPAGGRICRVQVASYAQQGNAEATLERLRLSGIAAVMETAGAYKRVVIPSIPEDELDSLSARLAALGYRRLLVSYGP